MGDLDIEIKVAVGNALAELARAEAQAKKSEAAFDGFAATFARIAAVQQRVAAEAARARAPVDNLAGAFGGLARALQAEQLNATARAFAGLTEQIAREKSMLDQIHGPAKQLAQDLQTLEMLYQRGAISAQEYTEQLAKMGQMHGPDASQAGKGAGSGLEGLGGQIASIAGPAGVAASAIGDITTALDNMRLRGKDVDDATNSILKFHGSIEGASAAMAEQRSISDALAKNITTTTHAYADVREATDGLGLSSKQMADITRNLSADLLVDGGSIEQVSTIMEKLRYSLEAGTMGTRELKAVWQQSPEVAESFAASIGKTYPELMRMAKEGKITQTQIEAFIKGLGTNTEGLNKYKERLFDVRTVMQENHEDFVSAGLTIIKAKQGYEDLGESASQAMDRILHSTTANVEVLDKMADKVQIIMTAIAVQGRFASDQTLITNGLKVRDMLLSQKDEWTQYRARLDDARTAMERAGFTAKEVADGLAQIHPPGWVDYYKQELDAIQNPQKNFNGAIAALDALMAKGRITLAQYREEAAKLIQTYDSMPNAFDPANWDRNVVDAKRAAVDATKDIDTTFGNLAGPSLKDLYNRGGLQGAGPDVGTFGHAKDALEAYDEELAKHKTHLDEIRDHLKPIEDGLVGLATTGTISWSKMIDSMLADLARLGANALWRDILNATAPSAPGMSGLAASIGSVVGGGSHAFGGSSYVAPQTGGGQDSIWMLARVSPGETVNYTPPGGSQQQAQGGGGPVSLKVVNQEADPRALLQHLDSPEGERVLHNWARRNRSKIKALLQ